MDVSVTVERTGDFMATVFELPGGRVLVTTNADGGASLFATREVWERAETPYDALENYDSVAEALADLA